MARRNRFVRANSRMARLSNALRQALRTSGDQYDHQHGHLHFKPVHLAISMILPPRCSLED